jgi:hypothetical protein
MIWLRSSILSARESVTASARPHNAADTKGWSG